MQKLVYIFVLGTALCVGCGRGAAPAKSVSDADTIPPRLTELLDSFAGLQDDDYYRHAGVRVCALGDFDGDGKPDSAYMDKACVVCKLSTHGFAEMRSQPIEILNDQSGIACDDKGDSFCFYNHWMRAGYYNYFSYDRQAGRLKLVGMSRYELGNATNDGSGESSVDMTTGELSADWNYYDQEADLLFTIPTIKATLKLGTVYLEDFSDQTYFDYATQDAELFQHFRDSMILVPGRISDKLR